MTDKLRQAADAFIVAWDSLTSVDLALAEPFVEALRQALAEPDMGIDRGAWSDVPDATKWVDELRGDEEPESTQSQEHFGKTEELESESKRLQELKEKNNA